MEPVFNYIFRVRKSPESPEEIVEVHAPSFLKAMMTMASAWPGVHVIKYMGIAPMKGGTA